METEPLEILTEALQRSRLARLEEKGRQTARKKGKARATERDEEEEAEFRRQIEEYDNGLSNVRDSFEAFMCKVKRARPPSRARSEPKIWSKSESKLPKTCFVAADDEEPIWNPLTNSYAYRETGFEPGPSCPSDDSRQHQDDMTLEHGASKDASLDTKRIFPGLPQVWMKHPEQTQPEALKYIPEESMEVCAATETLRTDHHAPTALRESAIEDVDTEEDSVSRKPQKLQDVFGPPNSADFVLTHAHERSSSSGNFRQSLCEPVVSHPQRAQQQQQQKQRFDQDWHILGLDEQELGKTTSEDETWLLALSLEKEDWAKEEEFGLGQRLALRLQSQEDGEVAARQAVLEQQEWLREELQVREETERQAAAEAERLNQELRAQEAVLQADGELVARLNDSYLVLLSDREYCEQLQSTLEREDAVEPPITPPLTGSWGQGSKARPRRGRSPICQVQNSTQQSQSQLWNDRAFAQSLREQDKKRVIREEEKARSLVNTWQENIDKDADRLRRRWNIYPSQAHASPQGWTTQQGHNQAAPGFQATQNAKSTKHDLVDEGACVICTDLFPKTQLVRPCEHFYCRGCLAEMFQRAIKDKRQPQCCNRTLPLKLVSRQLGPAFVTQYQLFELEIKTPNPLYCSKRKCSAFITPQDIHGDIGVCKCKARTCRHCREGEHPNTHCAEDEETRKVEAMGKKRGWKHCPKCNHLIEKKGGCLQMTCRQCRTDFCFNCLKRNCNGTCPRST